MSTIHASNYGDGTAAVPASAVTKGTAKAWFNLNGTGAIAVLGSYNVSSFTDNGVGDYSADFSNAFGAANYSAVSSAYDTVIRMTQGASTAPTASAYRLISVASNYVAGDAQRLFLSVHGDLA